MYGKKFLRQWLWHSIMKLCTNNYENPSIFVKVTAKKSVAPFFWTRCTFIIFVPRRAGNVFGICFSNFSVCRSCNDMIFCWYKKFVTYLKQQLIHLLTQSTVQLGKFRTSVAWRIFLSQTRTFFSVYYRYVNTTSRIVVYVFSNIKSEQLSQLISLLAAQERLHACK